MTRSEDRSTARRGWSARARWVLVAVLVVAVVAGTWWVAGRMQSPAQRDAAAAPPSPAPVVAEVVRGDLTDEITARSRVAAAQETAVPLVLAGEGRSVVTRRGVEPGGTLSTGQAVLWVNDRPVIALSGSFPTYRDLVQGDSGEDVAQLQRALQALGYSVRADGSFGAATAQALQRLYRALGSNAPTVTREVPSAADSSQTAAGSASAQDQAAQTTTQTLVALPQSEVVFIAGLDSSQTVVGLPAQGTVLNEQTAVITLASGATTVKAEVTAAVAASLQVGASASTQVDGATIPLRITAITENEQEDTSQAAGGAGGSTTVAATFTLDFEQTGGEALAPTGDEASLVVVIERTAPVQDALLVPKRALSSAPDGSYSVLIEEADGSFTATPVTVLACVAGQCALDEASGLSEGDRVRVDGQ